MTNRFDEMREAVRDAENTLQAADIVANKMAQLLVGRLHKVYNHGTLKKLKKELRAYNMHTGEWK